MLYISRGFNDTFVITNENGKILTAHDIEGVIKILKAKKKETEEEIRLLQEYIRFFDAQR